MRKRGALQISFGWLFAIIVGAFILFLSIYAATKIINQGNIESDTKIAKSVLLLFNPLESSFESGKTSSFTVPSETRIYNSCDFEEGFGKQKLRVSQKSFDKWSTEGLNVSFQNKYVFSEDPLEGEKFYLFSKPLEMPFKVADLIYLTSSSKEYCLEDMPDSELRQEIEDLGQSNPQLALENCSQKSIKVCFGSSADCDINVNDIGGYLTKNNTKVYFTNDALMMAAIFSDTGLYQCQVTRLMQRTGQIARLYVDKESIIRDTGCNSNLAPELTQLATFAREAQGSEDLQQVQYLADTIAEKDTQSICRLW